MWHALGEFASTTYKPSSVRAFCISARSECPIWVDAVEKVGDGRASTPAAGDEERGLPSLHPTVKPVTLVADALMDCSARNGLVLDPFAGSGTTIIAAERTGRRARAIELDPRYVDVAVRRLKTFTGACKSNNPIQSSPATATTRMRRQARIMCARRLNDFDCTALELPLHARAGRLKRRRFAKCSGRWLAVL